VPNLPVTNIPFKLGDKNSVGDQNSKNWGPKLLKILLTNIRDQNICSRFMTLSLHSSRAKYRSNT